MIMKTHSLPGAFSILMEHKEIIVLIHGIIFQNNNVFLCLKAPKITQKYKKIKKMKKK